jgi:hypothetical protein
MGDRKIDKTSNSHKSKVGKHIKGCLDSPAARGQPQMLANAKSLVWWSSLPNALRVNNFPGQLTTCARTPTLVECWSWRLRNALQAAVAAATV